ncbi:MAG: DUF559 domain-containing protein [Dietzia sp.]
MTAPEPGEPFLGSAALAAGRVSDHRLRTAHHRVFPDVYVSTSMPIDPTILVRAATLWAPSGSVVCGMAAAHLHGERWYAPESITRQVEMYGLGTPHAPVGVRLRRLRSPLPPGQLTTRHGMQVTAVARTAIDVARWDDDDERAIAKVDALCNRTGTDVSDVSSLASQLSGVRGLPRVRSLLGYCDRRADSPPETRLRLILWRSELPDPEVQVTIYSEHGVIVTTADFGYSRDKVAIFYDGRVHSSRSTWERDSRINAELAEVGWQVVRITAQMLRNPAAVVRQIRAALARGRCAP